MKNDKFLPYAVILGVVAIVAIVTLFMGKSGVEGNAVQWREYTGSDQFPCMDSDPTNDFKLAGYLDRGNYRYNDYCLNEKTLHQYACFVGNKLEIVAYKCPNGCKNGVCI